MGIVERIPPSAVRWLSRQQFAPVVGPLVNTSASWLRRRPRVVAHGQAAGLVIDPAGANPGYALGTTEPLVQERFAAHIHAGEVVWDVGANIGFYSLIASRLVGAGGEVVAFEPLPANVTALERNVRLNAIGNVRVAELAIGDREGTAELFLAEEQTWAKLDTSADTGFHEQREDAARLTVALSTLDRQLELRPAPNLVKIDVEGAEMSVLRGARRLLEHIRPTLICELHGTNAAVSELLESHAYKLDTIETPTVPVRDAKWDVHVLATPG